MGRPKKQTVDYFPHYVGGSRKTLFLLESDYGNDGYAFWFKLLELLGSNEGHYYDISSAANRRYLYAYTKVEEETATKILDMLVDLGNIDKELYSERKIIWCQSLVDNLKDVYDKRTTPLPKKPFYEDNLPENPRKAEETEEKAPEKPEKPPKPTPRKKSTPKKTGPAKVKRAEFVELTDEEYEKLVNQYGKDMTARMIEVLDNYKGQSGKTYKSDYRAILNWVVERVQEEQRKGGQYGRTETHRGDNQGVPAGEFRPSGGFRK
jgi:hypothetical protein